MRFLLINRSNILAGTVDGQLILFSTHDGSVFREVYPLVAFFSIVDLSSIRRRCRLQLVTTHDQPMTAMCLAEPFVFTAGRDRLIKARC